VAETEGEACYCFAPGAERLAATIVRRAPQQSALRLHYRAASADVTLSARLWDRENQGPRGYPEM
jgi:hypothetical protein